jgi:CDP-diacylglycerol--glycerol-3-phosphate 3-phosphatidyltransferase
VVRPLLAMVFTTPNLLTLGRIATVPLIVYLMLIPGPAAAAAAAAVFFLATITDFLDGYIARSFGSGTNLGKFLDPLADKIIITATLIMLVAPISFPGVPAWIVVVMVAREFAVTGLRAIAAAEGQIIAADDLGKYKMALQCIAIEALLIRHTYFYVDFFAAGMFLLWIAMVVSIWSGIDYFYKARGLFLARPSPQMSRRAAAQ